MMSGSLSTSTTRMRGFSDAYGSWNTICSRRRSARSSPPESFWISRPSKRITPDVGSSRRSTSRPVVDLPHPDSPTRPTVSRRSSVRLTPSTACTTPCSTPPEVAALDGEVLDQVLDLEHRAAAASARPSDGVFTAAPVTTRAASAGTSSARKHAAR